MLDNAFRLVVAQTGKGLHGQQFLQWFLPNSTIRKPTQFVLHASTWNRPEMRCAPFRQLMAERTMSTSSTRSLLALNFQSLESKVWNSDQRLLELAEFELLNQNFWLARTDFSLSCSVLNRQWCWFITYKLGKTKPVRGVDQWTNTLLFNVHKVLASLSVTARWISSIYSRSVSLDQSWRSISIGYDYWTATISDSLPLISDRIDRIGSHP